jgi:hypothetical protein
MNIQNNLFSIAAKNGIKATFTFCLLGADSTQIILPKTRET